MKLHVKHVTRYQYSDSVTHSVNRVCLIPRDTPQQKLISNRLKLQPEPEHLAEQQDMFGNSVAHFNLEIPHRECVIESSSVVETPDAVSVLPTSFDINALANYLLSEHNPDTLMASHCLLPSQHVPLLQNTQHVIDELRASENTVLGFASNLMSWIYNSFDYDPSFSTVVTPAQNAWDEQRGVCQDFAHVAIAVLREAGIAARYVSGYLETLPPPGKEKLQGSDASHAWYSVYAPGAGWFDFDPTNNKRPDTQYITTAWGRDYADVAPLKGIVYGGGRHIVSIAVDVERFDGVLSSVHDKPASGAAGTVRG